MKVVIFTWLQPGKFLQFLCLATRFFNVAQRTLRDIRDTNSYTVRKLADGNCWMTQGLKYSLSANTTRVGVNHSTNQTFNFNTGSSCASDGSCIMNGNTAMVEQTTNGGYYYSWYAATAGTGTTSTVGESTGSICPKGWRLPANYTSNAAKSYGGITDVYLGFHVNTTGDYLSKLEVAPLNFKRAGIYYGGTFHNSGTPGYYWSNTAINTTNAYPFGYQSVAVDPQGSNDKYFGFTVRCVNN